MNEDDTDEVKNSDDEFDFIVEHVINYFVLVRYLPKNNILVIQFKCMFLANMLLL